MLEINIWPEYKHLAKFEDLTSNSYFQSKNCFKVINAEPKIHRTEVGILQFCVFFKIIRICLRIWRASVSPGMHNSDFMAGQINVADTFAGQIG